MVEAWFGRSLLRLQSDRFHYRVQGALQYWRAKGFPHSRLTEHEIDDEIARLQRSDRGGRVRSKLNSLSTVGLRVANAFHPQMWYVPSHRHLRSPIDYYDDDEHLTKILQRAPRLWPNRRCWNAQCVRSSFRIAAAGRVANFRPVIARRLVQSLCREHGTVLDFSAGYGGRLFGALSLPVHYIGIDAHPMQILGLTRMLEILSPRMPGSGEVIHGGAEDIMRRMGRGSIDMVLSSPPYFNLERYADDRMQSAVRYRAYEEWLNSFLDCLLRESYRVLRRGGVLALNVANVPGYPIADHAEAVLRARFRRVDIIRMPMRRVPSHRQYAGRRFEPVFVCVK
ncbi:MAG TPA: hypothetical protein VGD01_13170 [Candidatus Elarobacter sp.]